MNKLFFAMTAMVIIMLSMAACKTKPADLNGTTWKVDHVQLANGREIRPPADYTVKINDSGLLLSLDVNKCRLSYAMKNANTIDIKPGACTRACCDKPEGEMIAQKLSGVFTVEVDKDMTSLVLRGQDVFTFIPHTMDMAKEMETDKKPLSIKRTGCFGGCPIYSLKLDANGMANYVGRRFVDKVGQATQQFEPNELIELYKLAEAAQFDKLEDSYDDERISDLESIFITYGDKTVKVRWKEDVPKPLLELIEKMHAFAMAHPWNVTVAE